MNQDIHRSEPLISVVLPVFNAAQYLTQALDSLASQTESNFEVLAIYDDSSDGSLEILQAWVKKDPRFQIVNGLGKGLVDALNLGLKHARGQYIARMDADDISLKDRFKKQVLSLESRSLDICGCQMAMMDEYGHVYRHVSMPISTDWVAVILACTVPFAHGSVMIKRDFLTAKAIRYIEGTIEDYSLWCHLYGVGARMGNVIEELYIYREHQSLSKVRAAQNHVATCKQRRSFVRSSYPDLKMSIQNILQDTQKIPAKDGAFLLLASYLMYRQKKDLLILQVCKRVSPTSIGIALFKLLKGF